MSLPPRPAALAGREELLARLHDLLSMSDQPRIVVLRGMGGVGKTSMAAEYAHRHLAEVSVAWHVRAEESAVLGQDMAELAAQLGGRDLADPRDPVASVHAILAAHPAQWLLIFDNAPDEASVRRFLPPAGRGRVIVTSQSQHWPGRDVLDVPVLDLDVAATFLVSRTGDPDANTAAKLAGDLGGLPLALEQAAAYMLATGRPMASYLELLQQRGIAMLARGGPAWHDKLVTTTWALALDRLQQTVPTAISLLRLLSCCAADAIPLNLLLQSGKSPGRISQLVAPHVLPLLNDPLAADDGIMALRRFSLVSAPQSGLVAVHRLVQTVTLGQLPKGLAQAWKQAAAALIDAQLCRDPNDPRNHPVFAALLPHAEAASNPGSKALGKIATYLGRTGNYAAARTQQHKVLEARERILGPEHPKTLAARGQLAHWTGLAGDAAAARDQYAALRITRQRILGSDHPATLGAGSNLAYWTGKAGDAYAARDQFATLLPEFSRVFSPDHPLVISVRANLARWTGEAGDPASARDQLAELMPVIEQVFRPDHQRVLTARSNLAHWTGQAGDAATAARQLADLVPMEGRLYGADHPHSLAARARLARWIGEAGDPMGAQAQLSAVLSISERVLGPEHPDTLAAKASLSYWATQTILTRSNTGGECRG